MASRFFCQVALHLLRLSPCPTGHQWRPPALQGSRRYLQQPSAVAAGHARQVPLLSGSLQKRTFLVPKIEPTVFAKTQHALRWVLRFAALPAAPSTFGC